MTEPHRTGRVDTVSSATVTTTSTISISTGAGRVTMTVISYLTISRPAPAKLVRAAAISRITSAPCSASCRTTAAHLIPPAAHTCTTRSQERSTFTRSTTTAATWRAPTFTGRRPRPTISPTPAAAPFRASMSPSVPSMASTAVSTSPCGPTTTGRPVLYLAARPSPSTPSTPRP